MTLDIGTKQKPCCWCRNKTKDMLLMPEQNKRHVVDAVFLFGPSQSHCHALLVSPSVTPCFEDAEFTQPLLAHDELNCWIFQKCYMDFSKSKPSRSWAEILKLVEASALNLRF